MSHRLLPDAPAGYTPLGRDFDALVQAAFATGDERALTAIPAELIDAAGECGYRSLLVLFGALRGRSYATRVLSYEGPFGVGYLVGAVDWAEREMAMSEQPPPASRPMRWSSWLARPWMRTCARGA